LTFSVPRRLLAEFAKNHKFPGDTYFIPEYTGVQVFFITLKPRVE